jgi:hypothetical protein
MDRSTSMLQGRHSLVKTNDGGPVRVTGPLGRKTANAETLWRRCS